MPHGACHPSRGTRLDVYATWVQKPTLRSYFARMFVCWCFEPSQPLGVTSGLNTNFNLSLSYSAKKSFNINHNISTAQLFQTYTHTKSHILLQNLKLSISQFKYFSTQILLQNTSYFIYLPISRKVVKNFVRIHISQQWIQRFLLKIFLSSLH